MKLAVLAASGGMVLLAGCGLAASPKPPTLWLPQPVRDLQAVRAGDDVQLRWRMPRHTTDNVELRGPQRAQICWEQAQGQRLVFHQEQCHAAGGGSFAPDKPAELSIQLPGELKQGAPGAAAFFVLLESPAGKTAGPSNAAWAATGTAPPEVTGLELQAASDGVVVHWDKAAPEAGMTMRLQRTLIVPAKAPRPSEKNAAPLPMKQTLEVELSESDPGGAVDDDAALDHIYQYTAQRVRQVTLDGRTLELAGPLSEPVTIEAKDVFPPEIPEGLAAVADEQAKTIDLSWRPDTAPDLAGYVVYRRDVTAGTGWERISGNAPIVPPSYDDHQAMAGHQYGYAVSAVDEDGNESGKSAEVLEELPQS